MVRRIWIWKVMTLIAIALLAIACAPGTVIVEKEKDVTETVVLKEIVEVEVTPTPVSGVVTLVVPPEFVAPADAWSQTFDKIVADFGKDYPKVTVELVILP